MTKLDSGIIKAIAAMACITALEIYALHQGIDGSVLSLVVGAIAGLGGYALAKITGGEAKNG